MKALIVNNIEREISNNDELISKINDILTLFDFIIFTKDWEKEIHPKVDFNKCAKDFYIFNKIESDTLFENLEFKEFLKEKDITEFFICGLSCENITAEVMLHGYNAKYLAIL